jgi:hypothetical protein
VLALKKYLALALLGLIMIGIDILAEEGNLTEAIIS